MSEKRRSEMKECLEEAWLSAVENANIRGKFKRALRVFAETDVRDVLDGLYEAPNSVWLEWKSFAEVWAVNEVARIHGELSELDDFIRKAAWEKARDDARRNSKNRLLDLQSEIVLHVKQAGGAIDYAPAGIAKAIAKKRTLVPARVDKAMRVMVRSGLAKTVVVGRGKPARFVLLT